MPYVVEEDTPIVDTPTNPPLSIVITELMIIPASPESDSTDEWVELYNPNNRVFDLSGFKLQTGSSYSYTYLFAETPIQPFGYLSVSSGESNLTLSDTAGAVRLLDTVGEIHGLTVSYDEVEEGSTYALDGPVEWYGRLPQLSPHLIYLPKRQLLLKRLLKKATAVKTNTQTAKKATSAKTTVAKTSATSSAKKAATKVTNAKPENFTEAPLEQKSRPLLLATFAVIAVLYGLYEYRHDPSNSVWRAKGYIRAWRKNR